MKYNPIPKLKNLFLITKIILLDFFFKVDLFLKYNGCEHIDGHRQRSAVVSMNR